MEKLFNSSRFMVLIVVFSCAVGALLLYFTSMVVIFHLVLDVIAQVPTNADNAKRLAVRLLKVLDVLLIAVTFQIISVGLYRLFIARASARGSGFLAALQINNFHDLKITLLQVAVVILVILFLEQAVEVGAGLDTLYMGIAFALMIVSAVWAAKSMHSQQHTVTDASADENALPADKGDTSH
ncbi:MAG: YqhA family protein [Pseudomonadaceae bacterium]|nr:MAG: YqhA family protein [Pseudomonadaceae bacterium]